jgi:hypothetical protein
MVRSKISINLSEKYSTQNCTIGNSITSIFIMTNNLKMCNGLITSQVWSNLNLLTNLNVFTRCNNQSLNTLSLFYKISRLIKMNLIPSKTRNNKYSTSHNKLWKMKIVNQARPKIQTKKNSLAVIICSKSLRVKFIARSLYQRFTERIRRLLDGKLKKNKI